MRFWITILFLLPLTLRAEEKPLRIGHFPNITHAQALLGRASGGFEQALGGKVEWLQLNAGPAAIEAMFSGDVDATYIGPTPAINGFVKSHGEAFVIIAGAAQGGAGLVVRVGSNINQPAQLEGKKIATPQLGNTQDIAARHFLHSQGIALIEKGGSTALIPLSNPDSLAMMKRGEVDAVWSVEPWLSRLEIEAKATLLIDEKALWPDGRYPTTVLIASKRLIAERPEIVRKLLRAHLEATQKLNTDIEGSVRLVNEEFKRETGSSLAPDILQRAFSRVTFNEGPLEAALDANLKAAQEAGFVNSSASIAGIWDLSFLNAVKAEMGKSLPK